MPPLELDFESREWSLTERTQMMHWYEVFHGTGDSRLTKFAPFQIDNNPAGFKRYRQHATKLGSALRGIDAKRAAHDPYSLGALVIHLYAAIGNGPGCLYEVIGFRMHGLTKRQIKEILAFAFLTGGPYHTNATADALSIYLDAWHEEDGPEPAPPPFPDGWAVDPGVFRAGVNIATEGMSASDVEALAAWHRRMGGDVPPHVQLWSELHPEALKTQRARFEACFGETLPAQLFPLMQLQHATYMGWPRVARRAMLWAQTLGVKREYAVSAMELAFLYGGEMLMEQVLTEDVARAMRDWKA